MNTNIFTNGTQLFTLENYDKVTSVSHDNGIVFHSQVSKNTARAMHSKGELHYIYGMGDRKHLKQNIKRGATLGNFQVK